MHFRNRRERLLPGPAGPGFDCDWEWTSDLTLPRVFPSAGRKLMRAALSEWPIRLGDPPQHEAAPQPIVSFIVGHRGRARLPHLLATLRSIAGQKGAAVECLVVEQDETPSLCGDLPAWVRYVPLPVPVAGMPYARSWAFNVGARAATGRVLVFHDDDVLIPADYAAQLARLLSDGFEAMRLARFVFYLDELSTSGLLASGEFGARPLLLSVTQNCQGHTIAVEREAYFRIGGHCEGFVGWGGEDNEFYDRCRMLLRLYPWGYLPFLHLYHPPQLGKLTPTAALDYLASMRAVPADRRARCLSAIPFGSPVGPASERNEHVRRG
jgi:hypothetical protein